MSGDKKKTFHVHGATEFRITVLAKDDAGKSKRVDFHVFEADSMLSGSLDELFQKAPDAHKYECAIEGGKLVELKSDEAEAEAKNAK